MPEYFAQSEPGDYKRRSYNWKISKFIADFWQIHPFGEGNTRTVAVFAIKYLRTLGFEITNEPFESHSWYFRNALIRANYQDLSKKIYSTTKYLEMFFENALLGAKNELKNRKLSIVAKPLA